MFLSITEIKKAYPYIENKDIDLVLEINQPRTELQYTLANGKPRPKKVRYQHDIESLFGPIKKDLNL